MFRAYAPIFRSNSICNSSKMVFWSFCSGGTPSAAARLHTTATHAVPSTIETPEHNLAAVTNTITPADGRIRPKHVELYNTCNKVIRCCIKLDTHLPYDNSQVVLFSLHGVRSPSLSRDPNYRDFKITFRHTTLGTSDQSEALLCT
jgi:hypothetical protein